VVGLDHSTAQPEFYGTSRHGVGSDARAHDAVCADAAVWVEPCHLPQRVERRKLSDVRGRTFPSPRFRLELFKFFLLFSPKKVSFFRGYPVILVIYTDHPNCFISTTLFLYFRNSNDFGTSSGVGLSSFELQFLTQTCMDSYFERVDLVRESLHRYILRLDDEASYNDRAHRFLTGLFVFFACLFFNLVCFDLILMSISVWGLGAVCSL
jgi:hypothetical protein